LGQIIRARRRQLDLTQKEVAERIKTSVSFIGYLELGKRRFSVRTMARLAKVLNLDERELLFLAQRRVDAMLNRTLDSPVLSSWEQFKNDDLLRRRQASLTQRWECCHPLRRWVKFPRHESLYMS
jgi:transcriptional regulator with XRE-family HTH domain